MCVTHKIASIMSGANFQNVTTKMPRSVNHVASKAKRTRIFKLTRGYYGARKNVSDRMLRTLGKRLTYAFRDRRNKKRTFRALWIQRINAAARLEGMSYCQLMGCSFTRLVSRLTVRFSLTSL